MSFWIAAAVLTVLSTALALLPLLRARQAGAPARAEHDVEVYRAQLTELDHDLRRGTIGPAEAAAARAEIGRRLLAAAGEAQRPAATPTGGWRRGLAFAVALVVPAVGLGGYAALGAPEVRDLPLASRAPPAAEPGTDVATLVAAAEARLAANPEDGRGWDLLAPIYLRLGETAKAETAFRNAIRLVGDAPQRQVGLGEALTQGAGGEVTDAALAAFRQALTLDPAYLPAQFFVALDHSQEARYAEALAAWKGVVAASPADAPWLQLAESAVADSEAKLAGASASASVAAPGPDAAAVEAAAGMGEGDRRAMIEGMVSQLAARLAAAPNDVEGWKRLMRSYAVLGQGDKARAAFEAATGAFPDGSAERRDLAAFFGGLGLGEQGETRVR